MNFDAAIRRCYDVFRLLQPNNYKMPAESLIYSKPKNGGRRNE